MDIDVSGPFLSDYESPREQRRICLVRSPVTQGVSQKLRGLRAARFWQVLLNVAEHRASDHTKDTRIPWSWSLQLPGQSASPNLRTMARCKRSISQSLWQ